MINRKMAISYGTILFLTINLLIPTIIFTSDEGAGWEFGGLIEPKTSIEYPVGGAPNDAFTIDINNDTNVDIITANKDDSTISILLGDGNGNFYNGTASPIILGTQPLSVYAADMNHDQNMDIVTTTVNETDRNGSVILLLGDGTGAFAHAIGSPFSIDKNPSNVSVADINHDTHPDIITASSDSNNVIILIGDGAGDFPEIITIDLQGAVEPVSIFVTDVNHDPHPDIISINYISSDVSVLLGDGNKNFYIVPNSPGVNLFPVDLFVADVNGDTHQDIITVDNFFDKITILSGTGDGNFTKEIGSSYDVGSSPYGVFAADINGDNIMDILTANSYSDNVSVLFGKGDLEFEHSPQGAVEIGIGPRDINLVDLNGDNILDIVSANTYSDSVSVILGHGYGYFVNPVRENLNFFDVKEAGFPADPIPYDLSVSGIDIDGFHYLATSNYLSDSVSVIYWNETSGLIQLPQSLSVGTEPVAIAISDLNQDGYSDIITANEGGNSVSVLKGGGGATFTSEGQISIMGAQPSGVFTFDVNGDGDPDIITSNSGSDDVSVLIGDGNLNFIESTNGPFSVGSNPRDLYVRDVNNDDHPDIITTNKDSNNITILFGDGSLDFNLISQMSIPVGTSPTGIFVEDINEDNIMDVITANTNSHDISILYGNGTGSFPVTVNFSVGLQPGKVFVSDVNGEGKKDIVVLNMQSGDVSILLSQGSNVFIESTKSPITVVSEPRGLIVADVTGGPLPDIITCSKGKTENVIQIFETYLDYDSDGAPDKYDAFPTNPTEWEDSDNDYIGNFKDGDDDNDGKPDLTDPFPLDPMEWNDTDEDGIGDNSDPDIDGDDYDNDVDVFPYFSGDWNDTDGDGVGDNNDPDIDGDGYLNYNDVYEYDPFEWKNFDGDTLGDNADPDDDNDGVNDTYDAFPNDDTEWMDTDNDGRGDNNDTDSDNDFIPNFIEGMEKDSENDNDGEYDIGEYDEFPLDKFEWVDSDGDEVGNNADSDDDNDNITDSMDAFPFDNTEWLDSDEDGTGDNEDPDDDNDGVPDRASGLVRDYDNNNNGIYDVGEYDEFPFDENEWVDTDGDGLGNNQDPDIDGDGVINEMDAFPLDPTEWSDLDGDGIGDNKDKDIDGDGYENNDDAYPWDPERHEESISFLGLFDLNLFKLLLSSLLLGAYSFVSTGYFYLMKRGVFLTGLFVFQKARKVPYYRKEIRRAETLPSLEHIFDKVEDEKARHHINTEQYSMIRDEADKRRIALTYSVLSSLTPEQQFQIFNDMMSRDEKFKEQLAGSAFVMKSAGIGDVGVTGGRVTDAGLTERGGTTIGAGGVAATGAAASGVLGITEKTVDVSGRTADVSGRTADVSGKNVDNVHFTITAPPKVKPRSSFVVDLWAHLEEEQKKVIEQAMMMADEEDLTIRSVGPKRISRGTELTAELSIEDMDIQEPSQTILWEGEIGNANYAVKAPEGIELGSKQGSAKIFIDGLRIAVINFVIHVSDSPAEEGVMKIPGEEHRIETAFASYARLDRDKVLPRIQGIQKALPSLNIFLDIMSLRSGQDWEKEIRNIIPIRDVFYLFWSENAQKSHWVEVEWRCALETRGIDFIDPIPLTSPEVCPPPLELATKHFDDWTLAFQRGETLNNGE